MKFQFNGEVFDTDALLLDLRNKDLEVMSIETSRWRDENGMDRGGRIDVEVSDRYLIPPRQMDTLSLEIVMIESEQSTVSGDVVPLYEAKAALFMA